jgi:hypothetical protein
VLTFAFISGDAVASIFFTLLIVSCETLATLAISCRVSIGLVSADFCGELYQISYLNFPLPSP